MTYQIIENGLCFDDVMLVPKYSDIESRSQVDLSITLGNYLFQHPIVPSNMKTICGKEMAIAIIKSGGLAVLHRFMEPQEQIETAQAIQQACGNKSFVAQFAASVGVKHIDREMVEQYYQLGVRNVCIDVAHGDSIYCLQMIRWIKENKPDMFIMAGNVATGEAADRLWRAGADAVKANIGGGSLCTTRIETGNGVPTLTTLMQVAERKEKLMPLLKRPLYIISDGGMKSSGDLTKSLCFSDIVMCGSLFSGCVETPSKLITVNGVEYKEYAGSSTHKTNHIEGVVALVSPKGTYQSVLDKLLEGVRSGMSYQGAHNLTELKQNPTFIRITNSGLAESHPHINGIL